MNIGKSTHRPIWTRWTATGPWRSRHSIAEHQGCRRTVQLHRKALGNTDLVRYTISLELAVAAEWTVFLGVLLYAYDDGGATATGLASAAMLSSYVLAAPFTGRLPNRHRPDRVRLVGLVAQSGGYSVGAACAIGGLATPFVVAPCMFALAAVTTLRPAGAVLLPAIVRSSPELMVANLWAGYCESTSVLLGPALGTLLLHLWGPAAPLAGSAVLALVATVVALSARAINPPVGSNSRRGAAASCVMTGNLRTLRGRPGAIGVLAVTGGQYFLVGAVNIVVVVAAEERLGLGDTGPGLLITAFGIGAFLSGFVTTACAGSLRRTRVLIAGMGVIALGMCSLATSLTLVMLLAALPIVGLTRSVLDGIGRIVLQRAVPPEALPSTFALLELSCGGGLLAGSIVAQLLIAVGGPEAALWGTAAYFMLLLVATRRSLRIADDTSDLPVVTMSLLRRQPIFAATHRSELEAMARSSSELTISAGDVVIVEGAVGDRFFAIAAGSFDVTVSGEHVATLDAHGGSFGEIALLRDVPRQGTVTAATPGALVAVDRIPFLAAVATENADDRRSAVATA